MDAYGIALPVVTLVDDDGQMTQSNFLQALYLKSALTYLELNPNIYRYAW